MVATHIPIWSHLIESVGSVENRGQDFGQSMPDASSANKKRTEPKSSGSWSNLDKVVKRRPSSIDSNPSNVGRGGKGLFSLSLSVPRSSPRSFTRNGKASDVNRPKAPCRSSCPTSSTPAPLPLSIPSICSGLRRLYAYVFIKCKSSMMNRHTRRRRRPPLDDPPKTPPVTCRDAIDPCVRGRLARII